MGKMKRKQHTHQIDTKMINVYGIKTKRERKREKKLQRKNINELCV